MLKMYHVEPDTKVILMRQPYHIDIKTVSCIHRGYINKTFILYTIHRHKIHGQVTWTSWNCIMKKQYFLLWTK